MTSRADVAQSLVKAGIQLLDEQGVSGLSLRQIAARAHVSHAAPGHHFGGLAGLKTAIATDGFRDFSAHLGEAWDASPEDDPFQRLLALNLAYIDFASARAGLFHLMFDQLPTDDPELQRIALGSYFMLKQACAPFTINRDAPTLETAVWSLTHGYAALHLNKPLPPESSLSVSTFKDALRLLIG